MLLEIIAKLAGLLFALILVLAIAGEIFGPDVVRQWLFRVRGRDPVTGRPTRRFPLP